MASVEPSLTVDSHVREAACDTGLLKIRGKQVVVDGHQMFEPGYVLVRGSEIVEVGGNESLSALATSCGAVVEADMVIPGFVDIHTHGIGGSLDVSEYWKFPEYTLSRVVKYGTTALLATMVFPSGAGSGPADVEKTAKKQKLCVCAFGGCACYALAPKVAETVPAIAGKLKSVVGALGHGAVLEGIHAEGPIVESLGGLPMSDTQMSAEAFQALLDMLCPALRVMTISPSIEARSPEPFQRIRMLIERGVRPALGHDTGCTPEEVAGALRFAATLGATLHTTHVFNVTKFHHRDCGLANVAVLPRLPNLPAFAGASPPTVEVIGDSQHVSPLVLQLVLACKPSGHACFITDGIAEPLPGLVMQYGGRPASVDDDEKGGLAVYSTSLAHGGRVLIGSCAMMLDAFRTAIRSLGAGPLRAVDLCCSTPAAVANLHHIGTLQKGKRADLVLLNSDLEVQQVFVAGAVAYARQAAEEVAPELGYK